MPPVADFLIFNHNFAGVNQPAMQSSMLEYYKQILEKVSFDPQLFEKELKKAISHLWEDEARELILWCKAHFGYEKMQLAARF